MLLLLLPLPRVPRTRGEERKERKEGKENGGKKEGKGNRNGGGEEGGEDEKRSYPKKRAFIIGWKRGVGIIFTEFQSQEPPAPFNVLHIAHCVLSHYLATGEENL